MLEEVMAWGLSPSAVTGDSWYSCVPNLKAVKKHGLGMMFGVEANRLVSVEKGTWLQVQKLDIPEDGLLVWLKDFGYVKVFRTLLNPHSTYTCLYTRLKKSRILHQFAPREYRIVSGDLSPFTI